MEYLPKDPMLLLSVVNMKLRDFYESLDCLCEDMDIDQNELLDKMAAIDYTYDADRNRFV